MQKLSLDLQKMHNTAKGRFESDPSKCFQRHIRELWAEKENHPQIRSLEGAKVESVSNDTASKTILKYEWLRTMGAGTVVCYALKINGEILGVVCFSRGISKESRSVCGIEHEDKAVFLVRGACVPWAPKNAASYLIRWACKLAYKDRGWEIFMAYSDEDAGEIGTVYQASNWYFIGKGSGRSKNGYHADFVSPEGRLVTSYQIASIKRRKKIMLELGLDIHKPFRPQLRDDLGWKEIRVKNKSKYVWFEGKDKEKLKSLCRYPFLVYPKRTSKEDEFYKGSELDFSVEE